MKDQLYVFGTRGFIFTTPWVATPSTTRQCAVLLLTASGRPFELTVDGRSFRESAVAIAPLTARGLRAIDVGLVSINIQPHHPCFTAFCDLAASGVLGLSREAFAPFDAALLRAYEGRLSYGEGARLFEDLVERAVGQLRHPGRRDARTEMLQAILRDKPACSLADVASELHVSYTGASQLFSRAVGVPFRTYQHWIKCIRAWEHFSADVKLTQIAHAAGFTDLAHLSRTWLRKYGMTPSYVRDSDRVRTTD